MEGDRLAILNDRNREDEALFLICTLRVAIVMRSGTINEQLASRLEFGQPHTHTVGQLKKNGKGYAAAVATRITIGAARC